MDKSCILCSDKTPQKGESMLTGALNHITDGHTRSKSTTSFSQLREAQIRNLLNRTLKDKGGKIRGHLKNYLWVLYG